jgi:REP element-mobilizing transposase RayT
MGEPLAFLLTFRTYGTWLHGDERGSVDLQHNVYGAPLLDPDERREAAVVASMKASPMELTEAMRSVVDAAIRDHCRFRQWELMELAVRSNHVHVLVGFAGIDPKDMSRQLKARATRWLRERGLIAADTPVWAARPGSRRYLWRMEQVDAAASYVREGQDCPR